MRVPADIDFAPSTSTPAKTDVTNVHPVPTSLDGGNTLDWSVHTADEEEKEEKRWKLTLSKKKGKEKETLLNQSDLVKQENQFVGALLKGTLCGTAITYNYNRGPPSNTQQRVSANLA